MKKPESKITPQEKSKLDETQKIASGIKSQVKTERGKIMPG